MADYVAFLRAVNVGGRFVKMEAVRGALSDNGFGAVETHIQSGNVRVWTDSDDQVAVGAQISSVLSGVAGFDIPVVLRSPAEVRAVAAALTQTPPPPGLAGPIRTYAALLATPPAVAGVTALDGWAVDGERVQVLDRDVLLWLTVPSHAAKLTNARIERLAGGIATTRDAKVIRAIAERWG